MLPKLELVPAASLFQTPLFRDSKWVAELCEEVGDIYVTDETAIGDHGHFTTFFGVLVRRGWYKDPVFHDLYVLHELWHRKTLRYNPKDSWLDWSRALIASELESSLVSECYVYFRIPGLRKLTFKHEIWVDRFLKDGALYHKIAVAKLCSNATEEIEKVIREERLRALNAPDHDDFLEHQIANYGRQNMLWCRVWAHSVNLGGSTNNTPAFRVVNNHMSKKDWKKDHVTWLKDLSGVADGIDFPGVDVPFPEQAKEFRPIYDRSLRDFGNDVLSR